MTEPTRPTSTEFIESDNVAKMEYLPKPAVMGEFHFNQQTEIFFSFIRRLMDEVIGPCRISGLSVYKSGPNIVVDPGKLLLRSMYFNLTNQSTFTFIAAQRYLWLKLSLSRVSVESNPAFINFTLPVSGKVLEGANEFRYSTTLGYSATIPGDIAGTGLNGSFTATVSPGWMTDEHKFKQVEFYDANGRLLAAPTIASNNATTLYFTGNVTGAVSARTDLYIQLASIATDGTVTEVLKQLPGTLSSMLHAQNSDNYTTKPDFYVAGAPTAGGLRVLTVKDKIGASPQSAPSGVLKDEINFITQYSNSSSNFNYSSQRGLSYSTQTVEILPYMNWAIEGTGSYVATNATSGVFTVAQGHDKVTTMSTNFLQDYVLVDSANRVYRITAASAYDAVNFSSFTVTVDICCRSGESS